MKRFLPALALVAMCTACQADAVHAPAPSPFATASPAAPIPSPTAAGQTLAQILDSIQVETHWLKGVGVDWQTGEPNGKRVPLDNTHCSAFAAAVSVKLGVYLLRPPEHKTTFLANAQNEWLNTSGTQFDWERVVDGTQAQALANAGSFVVASYKNPNPAKHGHIAIVRPNSKTIAQILEEGPQIIQAGGNNYNSTSLKKGFAAHPSAFPKGQIQFFVHSVDLALK